jgi:protein-disulfide isomerase
MAGSEQKSGGGWLNLVLAGAAGLGIGAAAMLYFGGSGGLSDERIAGVVRNTIMAEPEMLPKAMKALEQREAAAAVAPRRAEFEKPYAGAWAGAADGDVTLVTFFDYACGYCRRSNEAIDRLLAEDPKLKVVWRELPVLGPGSQQAAFVSLAAAEQGKYRPFYQALFAAGQPTPAAIERAAAAAGVQAGQPSPQQQAEIRTNMDLATIAGANGTPTFVVGDQVIHGAVPYEQLKAAVAAARERRGS